VVGGAGEGDGEGGLLLLTLGFVMGAGSREGGVESLRINPDLVGVTGEELELEELALGMAIG
jgi:hypothetical protein